MQYETSRQISYKLNLQTSADLKFRASKGQQGRVKVEISDSGLETKGWRRLDLCMVSVHRCNTFVVNLCGCRLTTMFENYFKHGYIFRAEQGFIAMATLGGRPCPQLSPALFPLHPSENLLMEWVFYQAFFLMKR